MIPLKEILFHNSLTKNLFRMRKPNIITTKINGTIILRITTFIIFYKIIGLVLPIILHDLRILENSIIP